MLLIITSPSWGGKTTLQNALIEKWWSTTINFTTREPRSEKEKDSYVFLTKEAFMKKVINGDFLENTEFNWEYYWVSKYLPKWNVVTVLDPVGRNKVMEKYAREGKKVVTVYLNISEEEQYRRLENRGWKINEIRERQKDFHWMSPTKFCYLINWEMSTEDIVGDIEDIITKEQCDL